MYQPKNNHSLKVESCVYLVWIIRTSSLGDSILSNPVRTSQADEERGRLLRSFATKGQIV